MPAERFDFPNVQGQKLAALLDRVASILRVEMERPDTLH